MFIEILQVVLIGIALSMDAFAVSITCGLTLTDLNKKKSLFIAGVFGVMQALMPLIGYWIVEGITTIVDSAAGDKVGDIASTVVTVVAFALLLFLGIRMIIEASKSIKQPEEEKTPKTFSYKEILYFGVATSIDALGSGVALHAGTSTNATIWLHVTIIMLCTFTISMFGIILARQIAKLFKGKYEISGILGGVILVLLGFWIAMPLILSLVGI